jgi:hypothetical protein
VTADSPVADGNALVIPRSANRAGRRGIRRDSNRKKGERMDRRTMAWMGSLALALMGASMAQAHEGHEHKVMGTIERLAKEASRSRTRRGRRSRSC